MFTHKHGCTIVSPGNVQIQGYTKKICELAMLESLIVSVTHMFKIYMDVLSDFISIYFIVEGVA